MRIRLDKEQNFTVLEPDGTRGCYTVLFTVRRDDTGREYIVFTDEKVRAFRKDPIYGSRFRRDGKDLLLRQVETEEEIAFLREVLSEVMAETDEEIREEERSRRRGTFQSLCRKIFQKGTRQRKGGENA